MEAPPSTTLPVHQDVPTSAGEMSRLIRHYNWADTPLGDAGNWPASLRLTLNTVLHSPFPMLLFWGEDLICFYNDAFRPSLGNEGKHPDILGQRGEEAWPDTWQFVGPLIKRVLQKGEPCLYEDKLVPIFRNGKVENVYWTFSYSPVTDEENVIKGVLVVCQETTRRVTMFQQAAEQFTAPIIVFKGVDLVIEEANSAARDLWQTGREVIGQPFTTVIPEAGEQAFFAIVQEVYRTGIPQQGFEQVYQPRNAVAKDLSFFSFNFNPIREADGSVSGVMALATDITQQKEAQEALRYRKALLEAQNNAVPDGLLIVDTKGKIISYNKSFAELWEMPRECLENKDDKAALLHAMSKVADPHAFINRVNECYAHPEEKAFDLLYLKDGRAIERQGNVIIDDEGKYYGWIWHFSDVTAHQQADAALTYQKKLLETVTSNTSLALFMMDERQHCIYMNEAAEEMTGFSLKELQGKQLHYYIHHTHPNGQHYPLEQCPIDQALPTQMRMKGEEVFVHKNGSFFPVAFIASPILVNGSPVGTVIEVRDTTEEKKKEHSLKESEQRFRSIADETPAFLFIVGPEAKVEFMNQTWLQFTGLSLEESMGDGWTSTTHPDELPRVMEMYAEAYSGQKSYEFEVRQKNKDGEYRWIYWKGVPRFVDDRFMGIMGIGYDITDRKKATEALKESEERFRSIANDTPAFIFMADAETNINFLNKQWLEFIGMDFEQAKGQAWADITHPDDLGPMMDVYTKAVSSRQPYQFEIRQRAADGQFHYVLWRGIPRVDSHGNFAGMMGVGIDVTESRKALDDLRQSEDLFRSFSNNIQNLAWIANGEGWIHWYNQRWYDYTGTTLEEMQGWGWEKLQHPDHRDAVLNFVKEAWKHPEPWELTFPLRGAGGEYRWFLTRAEPIVDERGAIRRWIGTNTDINDQVEAQQALKQSEEQMRLLSESLPQIVLATDSKGNPNYFNKKWYEFTGFSEEETINSGYFSALHPDDLAMAISSWKQAVENGSDYQVEFRMKRADGNYRWLLARATPFRNEQKEIVRWFGTCTDIHDQKMMTERLEELVKERTKELQASNEDLQQFAHVASHDLKEPVRKIRTFAGRLQSDKNSSLSENGHLFLGKIENSARRMYEMIEGVLSYSTLSATQEEPRQVDLNEIIHQIEGDLEVVMHQKGATISYRSLPVVQGAPVLLHQLFYNLLNNSLKFSKPGLAPAIEVVAEKASLQNKSFIKITVKDNGIGFSQEHAARIFETFSRLNSKDQYEGTGLGLSLCKKIVDRHGGLITANSMPGDGTEISVLLPA